MAVERRGIPFAPLVLGLGGLIPFWGLALGLIVGGMPAYQGMPLALARLSADRLDLALAAYAAVIVSFLGGIRWGFAVREADDGAQYAIGVIPSLLAWAALAAPEPWRLLVLAALLVVLWPLDQGLVTAGVAPAWFGRLRMILSLGAGAALLVGALGTLHGATVR